MTTFSKNKADKAAPVRSHRPAASKPTPETATANSAHLAQVVQHPSEADPEALLQLQREYGNRAVQHLVVQAKLAVGPVGDVYEQEADRIADQVMSQPTSTAGASGQAVQRQPLAVTIRRLAQRAPAAAEEELPAGPSSSSPSASPASGPAPEEELQAKPLAQRAPAATEEELSAGSSSSPSASPASGPAPEEELQAKPLAQRAPAAAEEELPAGSSSSSASASPASGPAPEEELQAKPTDGQGGFTVEGDIESRIASRQGQGQPLPEAVRANMEERFGAGFAGVKVHADGEAAQISRSVQARAFTLGQDVYFGAGEFSPNNAEGQRLLAHELTHVIQQTGAAPVSGGVQREEDATPSKKARTRQTPKPAR